MPDIAMCRSDHCPSSKSCFRHKDSGTKPNEGRQSYYADDRPAPGQDKCDRYWPLGDARDMGMSAIEETQRRFHDALKKLAE